MMKLIDSFDQYLLYPDLVEILINLSFITVFKIIFSILI